MTENETPAFEPVDKFLGFSRSAFQTTVTLVLALAILALAGSLYFAQERGAQYRQAISYLCTQSSVQVELLKAQIDNTDKAIRDGTLKKFLDKGIINRREYDAVRPQLDAERKQLASLQGNNPCSPVKAETSK